MKLKLNKRQLFYGLFITVSVIAGVLTGVYFSGEYILGKDKLEIAKIGKIDVPAPTNYGENGTVYPQPLSVTFNTSVAALDKIGQNIKNGINIQPDIRGSWQWISGDCLIFTPETDWLPNTSYKVTMSKKIFSPQIKIDSYDFRFNSPEFVGNVIASDFYEDPRELKNKSVTASFKFTYPLDIKDLKKNIQIKTVGGEDYDFDYKLEEHNTVLHIVSKPVKIKDEEDFAKINIQKLGNAYNQKLLKNTLETTVKIPSSTTFFKIKRIFSEIVRNPQKNNNPEQILTVEFTTAVNQEELAQALKLKYSKEDCSVLREKLSKNQISETEDLNLENVSQTQTDAKTQMFKYDSFENKGCLLALIDNNLTSIEGFKLGKEDSVSATAVNMAFYPLEADMAFDGAILSLQGSRKIGFISRGVKELDVDIARIKESDLNHLVTQTYGNFEKPNFEYYNFSEEDIAEIFHKKLPIISKNPAEANYSSLDLNEYLENRKGVFLLSIYGKNGQKSSYKNRRLLLMTDLGIVVKDNVDKTHDVFVSNIALEQPVVGADVQVLGKNGQPVLTAVTDKNGVAKLGDFSAFTNEKSAVVYKVIKDGDISFLPINKEDRMLNMSRFDVGGDYIDSGNDAQNSLKGYIFSDRGVYRPSETGHLGILVRQANLTIPQQLPLDLIIRKPNGEIFATQKLLSNADGFMSYDFVLPETVLTGVYSAELWLNGKDNQSMFVAYSFFRVEEFMPDTMKIKAEISQSFSQGWYNNKTLTIDADLQNLYGIPAAGHVLQTEYNLMPVDFSFESYKEYKFCNPYQENKVKTLKDTLPDVKTDSDGKAEISINLSDFTQGMYKIHVNIDGLENGGARGVGTSVSAYVSPADYLIGWKTDGKLDYIYKGAERKVDLIAVNNELQTIELKNLSLKLMKKNYVSALVEQNNGTYQYQTVSKEILVKKSPLIISALGFSQNLETSEAGDYVLLVCDNVSGKILAKIDYSVSGEMNTTQKIDKNTQLGVKLDKKEYNAGETIKMQISAPYQGYGLITIERDSVYAYKWFKMDSLTKNEEIVLPKDVEINAYVNIAVFRSLSSSDIYLSPLSYATVPFSINKENRKLDIELEVPQKIKSGGDLQVKYKTAQDAKIIIYGVNEGILQVSRYNMPNLLDIFMAKRALRVITSQIMDLVMPDIRFFRNLSSSGGDGGESDDFLNRNLNPFARKTDKPVAFWSGILQSDGNENVYSYHVPETFNGKIKIMAVAVSKDKFGSADKSVLVQSDFALVPSGPYNVTPSDEFIVGLSVGNLLDNLDDKVAVNVSSEDDFEFVGDTQQIVNLPAQKETFLNFRLKAGPKLGAKTILFTVQSLSDASRKAVMPFNLSVRSASPYSSKFDMGLAKSSYSPSDVENMYDEYRVQKISASSSPLVFAQGLLQYLNKYPHYCTEQTVSKIFPAMELFFKSPELLNGMDVYTLFDDAMRVLRERQAINGGFASWNSDVLDVNTRDSLYASHFLVLAKKHGFNVPEYMLNSALSYCESVAALQPSDENDIYPAYASYILTLNGNITTNYLLNLEEFYKAEFAKDWQKNISTVFLAASYKLLQDEKHASLLFGQYEDTSNATANAMNIYLTAKHFPEKMKTLTKNSVEQLLKPLSEGNFTTYSAGWSVLALNAFNQMEKDKEIEFSPLKSKADPFPTMYYTPETKNIKVSAPYPFYYVNAQQGFSKNLNIKAYSNGLEVSKTYFDRNGQIATHAKLGDVLTVKVNYRSNDKEPIFDVAFVDLFAGCFEMVDNSLETGKDTTNSEIREDRVNVYAPAFVYEQSFSYKVKVVAEGTFILPAVYASAMYQPLARANSTMSKIVVGE